MNSTLSGSELHRTEESECDLPRLFTVPPSVLSVSSRKSGALLLIHSLASCIYPTQVARVLVGRYSEERVSWRTFFMRMQVNLTPFFNSNTQAQMTCSFTVLTNVAFQRTRALDMLQIFVSLMASACPITAPPQPVMKWMRWTVVHGFSLVLQKTSATGCRSQLSRIVIMKPSFTTFQVCSVVSNWSAIARAGVSSSKKDTNNAPSLKLQPC